MKCPNCNKEVLPEWKTCPYCEFKPKLCSDPNCKSIWLPRQAHFCPKCGSPVRGEELLNLNEKILLLIKDVSPEKKTESYDNKYDDTPSCPVCGSDDVTDDGSNYLQYQCNDCKHIWGDNNEEEEDDSDNYEDELHKFFPVVGITLGETTVEEAEKHDNLYDEFCYYSSNHEETYYYDEDGATIIMYNDIQFRKEDVDACITNIYMTCYAPMFEEWEELGFNWGMSYNEWKELFVKMGYDIQVIKRPHKEYWEKEGYWYLDAIFIADSPDNTIRFKLVFDYGRSGHSQSSKKTLYSISVYSSDSSRWDE